MLTIIEGLDRTGKTSFCTSQPVHTRSTYLHFEKPKRHPLDEYVRPLLDYVPGSGADVWCDRHYLGEIVWPTFFNRPTQMDAASRTWIELFLQSRGVNALYATHFATSTEDEPIAGREQEASELFHDAIDSSILSWGFYRWNRPESRPGIHLWASDLEREAHHVHRRIGHRWVGTPHPELLLVGEQVGFGSHGWDLPFVPYRSTSGHFMLTDLGDFFMDYDVAIINALHPHQDRPEELFETWACFYYPKVVALGRVASNELTAQNVPHQMVPHPQYWRRFQRRRGPGSYRKMIEEAIT